MVLIPSLGSFYGMGTFWKKENRWKDNEKRVVTKILTFAHVFLYIFLKTMNYCIFIVEEEKSHFSKQLNANCTQTWCDLPVLQQWACCPVFQSWKGFQMEESKSLKIAIAQLASGFGNLNVMIPVSTKSHWKPLNSVALGWRTILTHVVKSHTKQTIFFCLWRKNLVRNLNFTAYLSIDSILVA